MIINIRGTSGSGKTTLMRHFFSLCDFVEAILYEGSKKIKGYRCSYNGEEVYVVGSYENVCGGADTIPSQDEICRVIEDFAFEGHVLFESLFISHIYARYAEMASNNPGEFLFIMLETPFDTCIEHIKQRRRETGKDAELKESVYVNARKTYDSTYRIRDKLTRDKLEWIELPLENRFDLFEEILDKHIAGALCH